MPMLMRSSAHPAMLSCWRIARPAVLSDISSWRTATRSIPRSLARLPERLTKCRKTVKTSLRSAFNEWNDIVNVNFVEHSDGNKVAHTRIVIGDDSANISGATNARVLADAAAATELAIGYHGVRCCAHKAHRRRSATARHEIGHRTWPKPIRMTQVQGGQGLLQTYANGKPRSSSTPANIQPGDKYWRMACVGRGVRCQTRPSPMYRCDPVGHPGRRHDYGRPGRFPVINGGLAITGYRVRWYLDNVLQATELVTGTKRHADPFDRHMAGSGSAGQL